MTRGMEAGRELKNEKSKRKRRTEIGSGAEFDTEAEIGSEIVQKLISYHADLIIGPQRM